MERSFPSRFELEFLSTPEVATLTIAALIGVGSLGGLYWTCRAKPAAGAVVFWFVAAVISPFMLWFAFQVFESNWRHVAGASPWLKASFWISLSASIVGTIVANERLGRSGAKPVLRRLLRGSFYLAIGAFVILAVKVYLTPVISEAPLAASRSRCKSNLKQIGLALHNYHKVYKIFPASQISTPPTSWRVQTLPFLYQASLYEEYVPKKAWDSAANLPIAQTRVPTFECPSRALHGPTKDDLGRRYTDYIMLTGEGTFSLPNKPLRKRDLLDGESNTLAVTEATGLNIVWTEPRDADPTDQPIGINFSGNGRYDSTGIASSWHRSGANALFADGAVRFLSENIDPVVLKSLTTVRGNEDLQGTEF